MKCNKCGAENFNGSNFCDNCGAQLAMPKNKNKKVIIGVAAFAVIAIAVGLVFLFQSGILNPLEHHMQLGYKYLQEGQYEEAILAFDKVIEIDENNIEARLGKIEAYDALGEKAKVKKLLEEILEIDKNSKKARKLYDEFIAEIASDYEIKMIRNDPEEPEAQCVIQCLDGDEVVWEYETERIMRTELEPISKVYEDDEKVYFVEDDTLIALDKLTGEKLWDVKDMGSSNSIVLDDENIYVSGYYGPNVVIVNKDGEEIYRDEDESYWWVYDLKVENDTLYVYYSMSDYSEEGGVKEIDLTQLGTEDISIQQEAREDAVDDITGPPVFGTVRASSELVPEPQNTYYVENIWDSRAETAWVEGVAGGGIGETVTFAANTNQKVSGMKILNGYCKSATVYKNNNRVKQIMITFSNGSSIMKNLTDNFNEVADIEFEEPVLCSEITVTIMDVYRGTKYEDTCISEIEFY